MGRKPEGYRIYRYLFPVVSLAVSLAACFAAGLMVVRFFKADGFGEGFSEGEFVSGITAPAQVTGAWTAGSVSEPDAVRQVSGSFGVPLLSAELLARYLADGNFEGRGIFKVKQDHLDLLRGRFMPGARVDLDDPVLNANIALGLISSFHDRGYSWEQAFLIYVWGWGELAPATRSAEARRFLDYVFGGSDE
jgi:hypothetical protein